MKLTDRINEQYGLFVSYVAQIGDQELVVFFSEARVNEDEQKEMTQAFPVVAQEPPTIVEVEQFLVQ